jgi:hypothetical protein
LPDPHRSNDCQYRDNRANRNLATSRLPSRHPCRTCRPYVAHRHTAAVPARPLPSTLDHAHPSCGRKGDHACCNRRRQRATWPTDGEGRRQVLSVAARSEAIEPRRAQDTRRC